MRQTRILILVLSLTVLFFGWRSYDAWTRSAPVSASPSSGPAASPIGISQTESPALPADLSAPASSIVARSVFRPDRKRFSEGGSGSSQRNYEAELSKFTLLGVLQMGNDKRGIVVGKVAGTREERWEAGPGDTLPGFRVKDVSVDGMTLTADGRDFILPLYAGGPKGTAVQATARTVGSSQNMTASPSQPSTAGKTRRVPGEQVGRVLPGGQAGNVLSAGQAGNVFSAGQVVNPPAPVYATPPATRPPPAGTPPAGTTPGEDMNYGGGRNVRPSPGRW